MTVHSTSIPFLSTADFSEMYEDAKKNLKEGGEHVTNVLVDKIGDVFLDALKIPHVSQFINRVSNMCNRILNRLMINFFCRQLRLKNVMIIPFCLCL
jgi:hypothetical protein